jgi:hypothetical protein
MPINTLGAPTVELTDKDAAAGLSALREHGLGKDDLAILEGGGTVYVDATTQENARIERDRLMRDPEWTARFLAGGKTEADQMMACTVRLCATVRPD